MASVDFEKIKTAIEAKAKFRHCDKEQRTTSEHSNPDINKSVTSKNLQLKGDYKQTCKHYDERIKELDTTTNKNKRSDRVTCMGLCIPAPADLDEDKYTDWFNKVLQVTKRMYGADNLIQAYVHKDEVHDYLNPTTGNLNTSRVHMHLFFIPEHEGQLNGKWFSSRKNMIALNNQIQEMSERAFGVKFMDGSKRKSRKTVEELKNESQFAELMSDIEATRAIQKSESDILFDKKQGLNKREKDLNTRETALNDRETALNARESDLNKKEDKLHLEEQKAVTAQNNAKEAQRKADEEREAYRKAKQMCLQALEQVQTLPPPQGLEEFARSYTRKVTAVQKIGRQTIPKTDSNGKPVIETHNCYDDWQADCKYKAEMQERERNLIRQGEDIAETAERNRRNRGYEFD